MRRRLRVYVHWWRSGKDSNKALNDYAKDNEAEVELPAYQAQDDFLTDYVTHPNPYDAQAWKLWYDTQQEFDRLKGANRWISRVSEPGQTVSVSVARGRA